MRIWSTKPWYREGGKLVRRVRARMPNGLWGYRRRVCRPQTEETRNKLALTSAKHFSKYKPKPTEPERLVEAALRARGLEFVSQFRFRGSRYLFDFAIPAKRILIEVDGCFWHGCARCGFVGTPHCLRVDPAKTALAAKRGWKLIRVKEHSFQAPTKKVIGCWKKVLDLEVFPH